MELVPEEELQILVQEGPDTPAARRAKKIARFQRQKAAESKLQDIKERKERRGRSSKAAALSTPIEAGEEDVLDDDGEEEREIGRLGGGGSDYSPFVQHIGIPAVDMSFGKGYPVYHSMYDDFIWMKKFGDRKFHRHVADFGNMSQEVGMYVILKNRYVILPRTEKDRCWF